MKRIFFFLISIIFVFQAFSQNANGFKYQAIARDSLGTEIKQKQISIQFSILEGSVTGTSVYKEKHSVTTNSLGLFIATIGNGTLVSGNFKTINWASGLYFLKIEIDINGGANYKLMGVTQLLSVPYAKYSDASGKANNDLDTSLTNEIQTLSITKDILSISNGNNVILPCCCPDSSCITSLNINPPSGYYYTGDYTISASSNTWKSKANMLASLMDCVAATVNNKIYVIGGYNGSTNVSSVQEYDPATNTWTLKSNAPTIRAAMTCQVVNGKIYVIGGHTGMSNSIAVVEEYNPMTDSWSTKTSMPTARTELSSAVVNNKIYVFGGWNVSNLSTNEVYDPSTDTWTVKASLPSARRGLNSIAVNNKIYVIGGYNTSFLSINQVYDPSTDTWSNKTNMTYPRADISIGLIDNKIFVIGGDNNSGSVNYNEEYDPATDSWTTKPNMTTSRAGSASAVWNNFIYVFGGNLGSVNPTKTNELYVPSKSYYMHCKNSRNY